MASQLFDHARERVQMGIVVDYFFWEGLDVSDGADDEFGDFEDFGDAGCWECHLLMLGLQQGGSLGGNSAREMCDDTS